MTERAAPDRHPAHNRFETAALPVEMWRLLDLITPIALRVAATLRIADQLTGGPVAVPDLAAAVGAEPETMGRLLRYLAARGVFTMDDGQVALNPPAELLLDAHPAGIRRWADQDGFGGVLDRAGLDLLACVRTGRPAAFGHREALDGERGRSYDAAMAALSRAQAPDVVAAVDWTGVGHVVDVGGGTGTLLAAALRSVPGLRGTLVELPGAAAEAGPLLAAEGVADRCTVLAADMLHARLPPADAYLLKFVVHTMDDDDAVAVLRRCSDAGGGDGRVLLVERVPGPADPASAVFTSMDLRMLVLGAGRERTIEEYDVLAARADLNRHSVVHTPSGPAVLEYRSRRGT